MTKKTRENPEDFIGWKSPDGKLEVIGIDEKLLRMAVNYSKLSAQSALKIKSYFQMVILLVQKDA